MPFDGIFEDIPAAYDKRAAMRVVDDMLFFLEREQDWAKRVVGKSQHCVVTALTDALLRLPENETGRAVLHDTILGRLACHVGTRTAMRRAIFASSVIVWNDHPETTHADVIDLLKRVRSEL